MFTKINLDWVVKEYEYGDKLIEFGAMPQGDKIVPKIEYHVAKGQCRELLNRLIPERYHKDFYISIMDIKTGVGAHTDSDTITSINHYMHTNNEETIFYTLKKDVDQTPKQIPNQTNGVVFDYDQLDVYDSFVAKPNETWILDVAKPHSVKSFGPAVKLRKAIVVQTSLHSYDQVLDMLREQHVI